MIQYFTLPVAVLLLGWSIYTGTIKVKNADSLPAKIDLHSRASIIALAAAVVSMSGLIIDGLLR